ncbi:MAG TPA: hypothetical protein VLQ93_08615 [Myxococcaceae bacterium]|nr:hypothetical protein [Myxococcaceae bacterium]
MRTATGTNPLFGQSDSLGKLLPRDEMLRTLSFAGAHPDVLESMGRQGAALAREKYAAARYAREMDAFMEEVLGFLATSIRSTG